MSTTTADMAPEVIDLIHALDDTLRDLHRSRRAMREAEELLALALHAVRNGAPEVTDEYVDRTLLSLRRTLAATAPDRA